MVISLASISTIMRAGGRHLIFMVAVESYYYLWVILWTDNETDVER